jgi:glycosyltransferase involved in cell wall biosynthesis
VTALRIAIASPGISRVQRGFERLFTDLFYVLQNDFNVTLFKGGGPRKPSEKVPPFIHRNSALLRYLPIHKLVGRTAYHSECLMFAFGMLPYLTGRQFDVVHTIDPPLTRILFKLRARLGLRFRLLHLEGTGMPPADYPPADHIQQVSRLLMDQALGHGRDPATMTLLPCGIHPERFDTDVTKSALRSAYGINDDTFVILSIAAIDRRQKRTDYLIDEVVDLQGDFLLLIDGSLDHGDPELIDYARRRLGSRVRICHVASDKVRELYRLADVLAHVSTAESFGLSIVEAASAGLPVIIHGGPHFRWLLGNPACWIDAERQGALAGKLQYVMRNPKALEAMRSPELVRQRFGWQNLKPHYADLYRRVAALPCSGIAELGGGPCS